MTELIIYSKEQNPQCEELKHALNEEGVHYQEVDIRNPVAITELRKNGCFALEPPIIQVVHTSRSQRFFKNDDLFWDGRLVREAVLDVMQVARPQTI
jgi:pyrimidine operon attenuation protein/uracil phosphoribosyltransferase